MQVWLYSRYAPDFNVGVTTVDMPLTLMQVWLYSRYAPDFNAGVTVQ
jgi:hypothetical protein